MFGLSDLAEHYFNADDRAAELNGGSYQNIPIIVRRTVNREFEQFVMSNISARRSFSIETTLRSAITFEQAKMAKQRGFRVTMLYVILDSVEAHLERVRHPVLQLSAARGRVFLLAENFPLWLKTVLQWSDQKFKTHMTIARRERG